MLEILQGHLNEIFKSQQDLYEERIKICKECPLFTESKIGYICDINKIHNNIRGCGCRLSAKARLKNSECVLKKWR